MSQFKVDAITNRDGSHGPQICGITTFTSSGVTLPSGPTEMRGGRGRGVIAGGYNYPSGQLNIIQKIEIATTGNATDFGDLARGAYSGGGFASATRGIYAGGRAEASPLPDISTQIQYITMSSQGGSNDFGDMSYQGGTGVRGASNNSRGLIFGGIFPGSPASTNQNNIDFITIASTGNATSFGSLTTYVYASGTASSPTRAVIAGGQRSTGDQTSTLTIQNIIEFITIDTQGNAQDFGDLALSLRATSGASSGTRAVFAGGYNASPIGYNQGSNQISYITIASEGDATDFGDLGGTSFSTSVSNSIRGVFGAGPNDPAHTNVLEYVTIASTGNGTDFGDMITKVFSSSQNIADAHGGIG